MLDCEVYPPILFFVFPYANLISHAHLLRFRQMYFLFFFYREQAVQLRAQQDREYREAAEADRLATIRQREEEERREAEEEENRQREELEAAQEMSRQLTQQDTIRKLKTAFDAIPEPDVAPAVSAVRFQLPSGKKLSRRFGKTETVQV